MLEINNLSSKERSQVNWDVHLFVFPSTVSLSVSPKISELLNTVTSSKVDMADKQTV